MQPTAADSVEEVLGRIDESRQLPDADANLIELLDERSPIYAGRRSSEVEQLRARRRMSERADADTSRA